MRSLGKQDVLLISIADGVEIRRQVENRVVYVDRNGNHHVNWFLGGKKRIAIEEGAYVHRVHSTSVATQRIA